MGKKRKTRQEKIILQLKRQLEKQGAQITSSGTKIKTRQEAIKKGTTKTTLKVKTKKKADKSIFFYNPSLIKKDLLKSLCLTIIIVSLEIVLYLKLR